MREERAGRMTGSVHQRRFQGKFRTVVEAGIPTFVFVDPVVP